MEKNGGFPQIGMDYLKSASMDGWMDGWCMNNYHYIL
jgi:hypothetical protein